jgi:hypothetical protein
VCREEVFKATDDMVARAQALDATVQLQVRAGARREEGVD